MNWTSEKPTVPGFYWFREKRTQSLKVVYIQVGQGKRTELWVYDSCEVHPEFIHGGYQLFYYKGAWSGPMLPPPENEARSPLEHVCGLQGFGRGHGSENDACPACRGYQKGTSPSI